MKVLHVASFRGNIGDNANHAGFRPWFEALAGMPIEWSEFEIRNVYRKTRAFDDVFAAEANAADLVVIGGGNYFELWVENSPTGTSISIPGDVLDSIRTPIFFNALGVDDAQGYSDETLTRFRAFLGRLLTSDQYLVSVRNDGAMAALKRHAAALPLDKILGLPDGGFFARHAASPVAKPGFRVGINLAGDMLDQRFPGGESHTYQSFLAEMAEALAQLWRTHPTLQLVFFAHIFRDLAVCADLLALLPDQLRRDQVRVAAYDSGEAAAREVFGEYAACDAVLAMRFHSNVIPIGHGVPTVGLYCYDQIKRLYDELESPGNVLHVRRLGFSASLLQHLGDSLKKSPQASDRAREMQRLVGRQRDAAAVRIRSWLALHDIGISLPASDRPTALFAAAAAKRGALAEISAL
jgi:polysaccharide pyruvyl transferase WcaK-like protein